MNKKNIPNMLCYLRMAAAPIIMFMLLYIDYISKVFPFSLLSGTKIGNFLYDSLDTTNSISILIAGIIFLLAMITDALDGYYARKYDVVSDQGKSLDPLADKVLIVGCLIAFYFLDYNPNVQKIMIIPLIVIIARELIVTILRNYCAKKGEVVAAMIWGKIKTLSQTIALVIYFIFEFIHFPLVGQVAVIIASVITLISIIPYLITFAKVLRKIRK